MSKNLLTYPYHTTSGTQNGITFTINTDGSILLNGTSTATVNIFFAPINAFMLPAGNYKMSNGNPNANGYMLIGAEQSEWAGQITGNVEFTKSYYGTVGYCLYQIPRGNTFNNVTIYPSIESTSTIADKLTQIANDIPIIYDSGYNNGFSDGMSKGEYDYFYSFWDNFQQNGERENYNYGFGGAGWTNETFTPQYDIVPKYAARMMAHSQISGSLTEILNRFGVKLDSSKADYFQYVFDSCPNLTEVPHLVGNYSLSGVFAYCGALTTASLEVQEKTTFDLAFVNCFSLENLTITGTIGQNIDLSACANLTKASVESVINHLSDSASYSTITFNEAVLWNNYTPDAFEELIATKPNWTISLA